MANLAVITRPAALPATVGAAAARCAGGVALGFAGLSLSVVLMVWLHVVASGQLSPVSTTMSDYIFVDGFGWMFGAAAVSMAVGGAGTLVALRAAGMAAGRLLRLALWLTAMGAVATGLFPTDPDGPVTLAANIHRYAAGVVFFCVPIAALLVSAQLAEPHLAAYRKSLRRNVLICSVLIAAFLVCQLAPVPESWQELRGLVQRALFFLELAVLAQLAYLPMRRNPSVSHYFGSTGRDSTPYTAEAVRNDS